MAIEAVRILTEIEKHTVQAKNAEPARVRESVAAIRALCDLLLNDEPLPESSRPKAMPLASPQVQTVSSINKLKEEDANGDSLFEF
ncbi:YwdI family protein [Planococcus sp. 107-1]|uniref:YwdI family protein n=1 Tax=Planococcus sp. 107-1 TaxID=2908840 RepID=UPI001F418A71|nr:YwdI family protein [Planococcus sp. 107-1]UJF26313.1 YwdI family protein [Planococcus sp. 107-1]